MANGYPGIEGVVRMPDGSGAYVLTDGSVVPEFSASDAPIPQDSVTVTPQQMVGGVAQGGLAGYGASQLLGGGSAVPAAPSIIGASRIAPTLAPGNTPPVVANMWQGATTGAQAGAQAAPGIMSYALPAAAIAAGGYGAYDQFSKPGTRTGIGGQALRGAAEGAGIGGGIGYFAGGPIGAGVGSAIGGAIGGIGGAVHGLTASGKGSAQIDRDEARAALESRMPGYWQNRGSGLINAGGGTYDTRQAPLGGSYNIDWSNPINSNVLGATNPIGFYSAYLSNQGDKTGRVGSQMASEMYNAAMGSDSPEQTAADFWGLLKEGGTKRDEIYGAVLDAVEKEWIDKETGLALRAEIDKQYGVENPNKGKGGEAEYGDKKYLPEGY